MNIGQLTTIRHLKPFAAIIVMMGILLSAQIATAQHALDHHSHEHLSSCDAFLGFNSSSTLAADQSLTFTIEYGIASSDPLVSQPVAQAHYQRPIRAPPVFTS